MYPRLYLARQLLRNDGVIFISIDDNEQAQLKILCDEIFGEGNFMGDFIRKTKSTTNDARTGVNIQHENCLCYAKDKYSASLLGGEKDLSKYKNPDNDPNGAWVSADPSAKRLTENSIFPVVNPYTGKEDYPPVGMSWRFSKNTIQSHIDSGRICFKKEHKPDERGFIYKRYLKDLQTEQNTLDSLKFANNAFMNQVGTKEAKALGLVEGFSYPKPLEFMQEICKHATSSIEGEEREIILDFFAGSGSTAHAVMAQNAQDGGNRRFILVQIDEPISPSKQKVAYEFLKSLGSENPSIFDITKERIKRAGEKIKENLGLNSKGMDLGFKVFESISKPLAGLDDLDPASQLPAFGDIPSHALLYTYMLYDGLGLDCEMEACDLGGYIGIYVKEYLYFLESGFCLEHCKVFMQRLEGERDFYPKKIIVCGWRFESARLRELDESLHHRKHKKGIEMIVRWF